MIKTDSSKHNICIAAIKRSTMKPYDFRLTRFYEVNEDFHQTYSGINLNLLHEELIIASTVIDKNNFSVLTTRQLITSENAVLVSGKMDNAADKSYGDFKGYKNQPITFGAVQLEDVGELKYFIETGKASMIMIHAVRTLIKLQQMSSLQIEKVTRIWNAKADKHTGTGLSL